MFGSGAQPQARQTEVVAADLDIEQGGRGCLYIGTYLLYGDVIGPTIQVKDMGPVYVYTLGVGCIPP